MANVYNKVLLSGLQASYDAMASHDANVLYFCTDTGKLYKGDVDFSNSVVVASTKPGTPVVGKIYILGDSNTVETYDGAKWHVISYPMATSVDANSDEMHVASAKAIYEAIQAAVGEVTGGGAVVKSVGAGEDDATVVVTKGDGSTSNVVVPGVVTTPTWDSATRKLTLPVSDGTAVEVTIGKDIFLDPEAENKYNPETGNIELHLNDGTSIEIPASALIDVYTGGNTNGAKVTVGEDNVIKAEIVVDPVEGNALVLTEAGLKVDLSNYYTISEVDAAVKVAKDAADAAQAQANENKAAIATLNGDATTEGSVDKKIADTKAVIDADVKAASDAAAAAQGTADQGVANAATAQAAAEAADAKAESAHDAIDVLNGTETEEGSVDKMIADTKAVIDADVKAASDAAAAAQGTADQAVEAAGVADGKAVAAQETADANAEEIAAIAAAMGWGTF